jgi:PmbA protein
MNPEEILTLISDKAKEHKVDQFDTMVLQSEDFSVEVFQKTVKGTEMSFSQGVGIRLFKDGRPGYSHSERFTKDAISQMVDDAVSLSALTDPLHFDLPSPESQPDQQALDRFDSELEGLELEKFVSFAKNMEEVAYAGGKPLENVPMSAAGRSSSQSWFLNSNGVSFQQKRNKFSAAVELVVEKQGQKKSAYGYDSCPHWGKITPDELVKRAKERSERLLGASPIESQAIPVLLSNRVSGSLISMFLSAFYAESAQNGQSRLADKLGKQIASNNFSLFVDPTDKSLPGHKVFDSEGVLCQEVPMVESGILQTLLYNLESASKAKVAPTGNGVRSYKGSASTGISNLIMPEGKFSCADMLKSYPKILLVEQLEGGAGCSAVSGEISIGIQGQLVEQGVITRPIDGVTMNGNFFDLLLSIEKVSDEYAPEWKAIKVPDLLIKSMEIAG